jgi:hypothetical protein
MPNKLNAEAIVDFQDAIAHMHDCKSSYVDAVEVDERMPESTPLKGQPVWQGTVHVFELTGNPKAKLCYAWRTFNEDSQRWRYAAVLHAGAVVSPVTAVQGFIVEEFRRGNLG